MVGRDGVDAGIDRAVKARRAPAIILGEAKAREPEGWGYEVGCECPHGHLLPYLMGKTYTRCTEYPNHVILQIRTLRDWTNRATHAQHGAMHLSDYMRSHDLTDTAVAEAIHVHRITVNRYRRRMKMPGWAAVEAIRKFTHGRVTANDWLPKMERAA